MLVVSRRECQAPAMDQLFRSALADAVLLFHLGIILFNIFGLIAIPVGAVRGWTFVRVFWWRALHVAILVIVALQAVLQRVCFLTLWQGDLQAPATGPAVPAPLIARTIDRLIYWPLPLWVFAVIYVAVCLYVLVLWHLVPPRLPRRKPS